MFVFRSCTEVKEVSTDEMRDIAARICRDYLTGSWKNITAEEIKFKRISGGLSNFLFYVSLPDTALDTNTLSSCGDQLGGITKRVRKDSGNFGEPKEVLLRIYGQTHGEHALETMLTESVVFALLSERNLGPKLHGIFPGGRIEQYIPARPLLTHELSNWSISRKVAEKMAEIHTLDIPVSKEPDWLWKSISRWLKTAQSILEEECNEDEETKNFVNEINQTNFEAEVNWLKKLIEREGYPVVFCHNDLQEGNILLKENKSSREIYNAESISHNFDEAAPAVENGMYDVMTSSKANNNNKVSSVNGGNYRKRSISSRLTTDALENANSNPEVSDYYDTSELFIIDYEYCAYNYRGFDLANHFLEWSLDYTFKQYPYYYHNKSQYPSKQQRHEFISVYLKKFSSARFENIVPSAQDIQEVDEEITVFSMVSHLFWCLWSIVNVHQNIEFGYWDYALTRLREYHDTKSKCSLMYNKEDLTQND